MRQVTLLTAEDIERTLNRMAHAVLEASRGAGGLALIGIRRRGEHLAARLQRLIADIEGESVPLGVLDITLYRDDFNSLRETIQVGRTVIEFPIDDRRIVLVDDVLYTGRTARAAIDEIMDFGRPRAIMLAVLIDRGHRELPIQPDFVGRVVPTAREEDVAVHLEEVDGADEVLLIDPR